MISRIYHVLKRPASFEDYLSEYNRFYIQKKEQEPEWLRSALLYKHLFRINNYIIMINIFNSSRFLIIMFESI